MPTKLARKRQERLLTQEELVEVFTYLSMNGDTTCRFPSRARTGTSGRPRERESACVSVEMEHNRERPSVR